MTRPSHGAALKRDRVREHLLELIEERRPGDAIPSERSLCARLEVSRPTLRAAVDELVATGQLVREHGRGMFIAPGKITQELVPGAGDSLAVPPASGAWTSRLLRFAVQAAGVRVGRKLRMSPAERVFAVARLRLVETVPMAIEYLHLPVDLVPDLTEDDLAAGDLYDHLRDRHAVQVSQASQSIEPTVVSEAEAELLDVPPFSPALLFGRVTTDTTGRTVEYCHSLYRGDRYRIVSRLSLLDGPPAAAAPSAAGGHHPGIPPAEATPARPVVSATTGDIHRAD
ncbi:GntR family transcriptional regulator [Streptomyces triticirhizae]|uniref:GntR family transcriptional regulator n=1 Tax=Streptomyces triticirhizae TaxID=2483353 RepID=A0A3M2LQN5_9ACTN|nr:GntR family transcriptional regulator [Streptomyces triticirhizae]RMI38853.1 GntR family transcriptional regulator [Streptomyces triticirhizae]